MSREPGSAHDPRDVDAEFARMLEGEGMVLRPGEAPREPAAQDPVDPWDPDVPEPGSGTGTGVTDDDLWSYSADSPPEPPSEESRARARAAHPSAGARDGIDGWREASGPRELDDDEVIYGDFEPPDPDLPQPSSGALWSWTALIGGFLLMLVATVTPIVPSIFGVVGGLAAVGGVVSLLIQVPRSRNGDDNGAAV